IDEKSHHVADGHGAWIVPVGEVVHIEDADRYQTRALRTRPGRHTAAPNSLQRHIPIRARITVDQSVDALLSGTHAIARKLIEVRAERRERAGAGFDV